MPNEEKKNKSNPEPASKLCKYQIFTPVRVHRSQLHEAAYNPRRIDKESRKKLKASVKEGLADAVVWNIRTGNVVGGHQRLSVLDELMKTKDYELDVLKIDVDMKTEKKLNIRLNNTNMMGEYDYGLLADLLIGDEESGSISFEEVGFTQADVEVMFTETELNKINTKEMHEEVREDKETIEKMKAQRKTAMERYKQLESDDFFRVIVFDTPENMRAFIKHFNLPDKEKYICGEDVASACGLHLSGIEKDEWGREVKKKNDPGEE